jgi:glycosyltransferase involved in cell wall biosynthesis
VVVPSIWWENSPVVIQEALAANVPLIASDIGGMAEKVRADIDGLHFLVGDYVDLAEKMSRIATRRRAQEIQKTMARPISDESFLKGLEKAFAVPLIDGPTEVPGVLTLAD